MKKEENAVNIEEFLDEYLDLSKAPPIKLDAYLNKSKVSPIEIEEDIPMIYGPPPDNMTIFSATINDPDNNLKNAKELLKDIITTKTKK